MLVKLHYSNAFFSKFIFKLINKKIVKFKEKIFLFGVIKLTNTIFPKFTDHQITQQMFNSRYRQPSRDLDDQRRMRFSSYHQLSHLLKRKSSGHQNSMRTQKETTFEQSTSFKDQSYYIGSGLILNSNDMRMSNNMNPEVFKQSEKLFYRSKPESRVNSTIQNVSRTSIKRPISAYRNTSLKIADLTSALDLLKIQLRTARCQMNLTLSGKTKISQSLQSELFRIKDVQSKEISGLAKKFKIKREMDVQRKGDVWNDLNGLWYSNENLKENLFQIQQRVQKLEIQMGNHSNL